jgi:hypothetical protein
MAILSVFVGGLFLDRLAPIRFRPPTTFYLCYFVALMLTGGIAWSVHLWVGSIMLAGIAGWLLSYLLLPTAPIVTAACPRRGALATGSGSTGVGRD